MIADTPRIFSVQAICGFTWPGIEFGEPPSCPYTFFEVRNHTADAVQHVVRLNFYIPNELVVNISLKCFPKYIILQYVDAIRFGDLPAFLKIESACQAWWSPTLDRGAGPLLHFAVDHGQLSMVKFLVEQRGVFVNQRCNNSTGWTPLHRCAYVAHYRNAPHMDVFEYLLAHGADPALKTYAADGKPASSILDLAVHKV